MTCEEIDALVDRMIGDYWEEYDRAAEGSTDRHYIWGKITALRILHFHLIGCR